MTIIIIIIIIKEKSKIKSLNLLAANVIAETTLTASAQTYTVGFCIIDLFLQRCFKLCRSPKANLRELSQQNCYRLQILPVVEPMVLKQLFMTGVTCACIVVLVRNIQWLSSALSDSCFSGALEIFSYCNHYYCDASLSLRLQGNITAVTTMAILAWSQCYHTITLTTDTVEYHCIILTILRMFAESTLPDVALYCNAWIISSKALQNAKIRRANSWSKSVRKFYYFNCGRIHVNNIIIIIALIIKSYTQHRIFEKKMQCKSESNDCLKAHSSS